MRCTTVYLEMSQERNALHEDVMRRSECIRACESYKDPVCGR